MAYDPTRPLGGNKNIKKHFDEERRWMVSDRYVYNWAKAEIRRHCLSFLQLLPKEEEDLLTACLAATYFDRFFSRQELKPEEYQLAGLCCFFLASKMRNDFFSVHQFLPTQNLNIHQDDILAMETRILNELDWRLSYVNALCFVGYFLNTLPDAMRPSREIVHKMICEAIVGNILYTEHRPSVIAAAAVFTASLDRDYTQILYLHCYITIPHSQLFTREELSRCENMIKVSRRPWPGRASSSNEDKNRTKKKRGPSLPRRRPVGPRRLPVRRRLGSIAEESENEDENVTKNDGGSLPTASSINQRSDDVPEREGNQPSDYAPESERNQPSDDVQEPGRHQSSQVQELGRHGSSDVQETGRHVSSLVHEPGRHGSSDVQEPGRHQSSELQEPGRHRSSELQEPGRHRSSELQEPGRHRSSDVQEPGRHRFSQVQEPGRHRSSEIQELGRHRSSDVQEPRVNPDETDRHSSDSDEDESWLCQCCKII